jgi:hypothetical protein
MKKRICLLLFAVLVWGKILPAQVELLGELTQEEILRNLPEWQAAAESYSPNPEIIGALQAVHEEVKIEIFLGTWCPDSKQHVSAYFKIMNLVQNPLFNAAYIGVPRNKDERLKYIRGKNIERIPTFIVTIGGREAGRIIETPQTSVEEDLWNIIRGKT